MLRLLHFPTKLIRPSESNLLLLLHEGEEPLGAWDCVRLSGVCLWGVAPVGPDDGSWHYAFGWVEGARSDV